MCKPRLLSSVVRQTNSNRKTVFFDFEIFRVGFQDRPQPQGAHPIEVHTNTRALTALLARMLNDVFKVTHPHFRTSTNACLGWGSMVTQSNFLIREGYKLNRQLRVVNPIIKALSSWRIVSGHLARKIPQRRRDRSPRCACHSWSSPRRCHSRIRLRACACQTWHKNRRRRSPDLFDETHQTSGWDLGSIFAWVWAL